MEIVEGMLNNAKEPAWLEQNVFGNFRAWQVIFLAVSGFTILVVAICCCIRFRVPRTKQQIEGDYQRRIITNKFRQHLEKIQNSQMDNIDLKSALDLVRAEFKSDTESDKEQQNSGSLESSLISPSPSCHKISISPDKVAGKKPKPDLPKLRNKILSLVQLSKTKPREGTENTGMMY